MRVLDAKSSTGLLKLEGRLKNERAEVLQPKEVLWMQKSRIDLLKLGDKITRFFMQLH